MRLRLEMRLARTFHSHFPPKSETGSKNETECDYEITLRFIRHRERMNLELRTYSEGLFKIWTPLGEEVILPAINAFIVFYR